MGLRVFWERKRKMLAKRPRVAKMAIIKDFKTPNGTKEETKSKGKIMSPLPKIKNLPPILTSFKGAETSENFWGKTRPGIALTSTNSFAIFIICFVL